MGNCKLENAHYLCCSLCNELILNKERFCIFQNNNSGARRINLKVVYTGQTHVPIKVPNKEHIY